MDNRIGIGNCFVRNDYSEDLCGKVCVGEKIRDPSQIKVIISNQLLEIVFLN